MARRAFVIEDSEDELPELATLVRAKEFKSIKDGAKKEAKDEGRKEVEQKAKPRRRMLNLSLIHI